MAQELHDLSSTPPAMTPAMGRCQTCQYWKPDHLADHRGHGIRPEVQWRCCTRTGYMAARVGYPYTAADFGCFLWEAGSPDS